MKIIPPSTEIFEYTPDLEALIERAGRTCYKSEDKIIQESSGPFIRRLIDSKHESVLEHGAITVFIVCDRGVSHELVRHRIASFSQESTRYCNYSKVKFGSEITVIDPCKAFGWLPCDQAYMVWHTACLEAQNSYKMLLDLGKSPEEARAVLPNSLKTEIVITTNPREWRWIFAKRCAPTAHPQMREIMVPLAAQFAELWPNLFAEWSAA